MLILLRRLWQHISRRRRFQFSLLFVIMILASLAEAVTIGAVLPFLAVLTAPEIIFSHKMAQPYIHLLNIENPQQLLMPMAVVFSVAVLVAAALRLLLLWAQTRIAHAIAADLSIGIYRRALYQPYSVHIMRNTSEVIASVRNKAGSLVGGAVIPMLSMLGSIIMLVAILTALFAIEPLVAMLAFVGFGSCYGVVILATRRRLASDGALINRESIQIIKALQEGLGGIRDVLIDGTQNSYCDIYQRADLPMRRAEARMIFIASSPRLVIEALGMVLIAALALFMAQRVGGSSTTIPVLAALALGAQRLLPLLQQIYAASTSMRGNRAAMSDALDMLDQPIPDYAHGQLTTSLPFRDSLTLKDISFRYTPNAPWVLREVNVSIPQGSSIGFIGPTGSGKSTLTDIVMGLLRPTEGQLLVDGIAITAKNNREWQAHIAHVPQAIFLADTSIAENIAFGVAPGNIDHVRVRQAAQKAQIAQTIESWDLQYETVVGERGVRLSGGQRQRIGIARALYKKADVLVFDEATSALDNDTEQAVMQAIESLGSELTILIVAHRLTTLRKCTKIVELKEGRISRIGAYKEIVEDAV